MNSYNNKNELIINEFFDKLAKALKYHSQNVRQFFEEETGKINVFSFKEKLKKLGYNEDKVEEVNILTNKFIKRLAPTIVDLDIIENELNLYQNRNSMGDSFSNIPVIKITNNIEPIKKEPEINVSNKPKGNYVYKNAHRQFTQEDIDHIYELCNFIADIIIDEKGMSITDFFNNADNYCKGFISMKKLKKIFRDDLEIDIDSDNSMDDFFDMLIADDKIEGEDIAKIKHIINVIKTYSGKDKPSTLNQANKQNTMNQNTMNQNTMNQNTTNLKATNTNNRFNSSINDKNNIK